MVAPIKGTFFRSSNSQGGTSTNIDYISSINDAIASGENVDPSSSAFQNAVAQFNQGLKKGSIKRLEIPKGFCGYIDPNSNELRVQPDPNTNYLKPGQYVPDSTLTTAVTGLENIPYTPDPCLKHGLPGSVRYRNCAGDGQPGETSGIDWAALMPAPPSLMSLAAGAACSKKPGNYSERWRWYGSTDWQDMLKTANDWIDSMASCQAFEVTKGPYYEHSHSGDIFGKKQKYVNVDYRINELSGAINVS